VFRATDTRLGREVAYLDRWGSADIKIPNVAESRRRLEALKGR